MRLIDADALEFDTEWSEYMDGFTSYSQFQIDYCGNCGARMNGGTDNG